MKGATLTVEYVDLDGVQGRPDNSKGHDVPAIVSSIERFGFCDPIELDERTGILTAGHGRVKALLAMREAGKPAPLRITTKGDAWFVPAVRGVAHDTEGAALGYSIGNNRLVELGGWLDAVLASSLTKLESLEGTGYTKTDLDKLMKRLGKGTAEEPGEEPPLPDMGTVAVSVLGDLWELGPHRLLCADALEQENRARLLGDVRADCVFTDPPYAIYGSSTGLAPDVTDDSMVRPFFRGVLQAAAEVLKPFGHVYVCSDWRSWASWWEVAKGTAIVPKNMIVWDKGGGGQGSNYVMGHELILFGSLIPPQKTMNTRHVGIRPVYDTNIWRVARVPPAGASGGREHNAQKPVDLVKRALGNSTEDGAAVVDLFMGSGTTIVATEALGGGRRCFGLEKAPKYADVAVLRWQLETGERAKLSSTGETFDQVRAARASGQVKPRSKAGRTKATRRRRGG